MFDTIAVSARVSDETQLTSIVICLMDANNSALQYSLSVPIQSKDFTFNVNYLLTEFHLPSGNYNLSVTANDGSNSTQRNVQIYITESPTVKTGYYIVGASQPKLIVKYNVAMAQQNTITLNTAFNGMAYGGYKDQLYVNGDISQPMVAYDVNTNAATWSQPYTGGGLPSFECIASDGRKAYIGYYAGYVRAFTETGQNSTSYFNGSTTLYPYSFFIGSSYAIGVYHDKFVPGDKLSAYFSSSGICTNSTFMPIQVLGIFQWDADHFIFAGNNSLNQAVFYFYTVSTNGLSAAYPLSTAKLLSAAMLDFDNLLLALDDGTLTRYQCSSGNATVLATLKAQKIVYNPKMQELNAAATNAVYTYSVSSNYALTLTGFTTLADSIIGFEVITNK